MISFSCIFRHLPSYRSRGLHHRAALCWHGHNSFTNLSSPKSFHLGGNFTPQLLDQLASRTLHASTVSLTVTTRCPLFLLPSFQNLICACRQWYEGLVWMQDLADHTAKRSRSLNIWSLPLFWAIHSNRGTSLKVAFVAVDKEDGGGEMILSWPINPHTHTHKW